MIVAGLMTGTSADALDVALVEFHLGGTADQPELRMDLRAFQEVPFDSDLALDILRLLEPDPVPLTLVSSVDRRLGQLCAEAVAAVSEETGLECELVVSHGQTIRHDVRDGAVESTLQLGQPAWIAERLGVPVLSDLRARDVAAGGQGAPLAGMLDHLLLVGGDQPRAMLNLGGIANVTVVSPTSDTVAFDTGPANALIDVMARRITGDPRAFDRDGELAARGEVDEALLADLLADPYYALPAPKSTGKELFHGTYLDRHLTRHPGLDPYDVIATLTRLTARTVAQACRPLGVSEIAVSGGGTRNPVLMSELRAELGTEVPVSTTDEALGLPSEAKEGCLMALLGWLSWHGLPATIPSVTGAAHGTLAGRFTPGAQPLRLPAPLRTGPARLHVAS
ncbi:anhydro-N-acetylmuramic acid kinase [Nesterenkonia sp. Act20]|uniref:anhydro-N-acetylmuramic acid kinase n=1 Tax=Nesterenkonia sp. Act20 TaxID=1483432 RepID=UPI001C46490E|nr:anhydro-N-acetylmuramic acid kinase [Nesterenkonia sp. Act20]